MKKFIFTLQKPYEIKKSLRDRLLAHRERLKKQLEALQTKKEGLLGTLKEEEARNRAEYREGMRAAQLIAYGEYLATSLDEIKKQNRLIEELLVKMEENTQKLMPVMNEIKVMEKIKEEQLKEYNKELQKNDDKMLEDFLCGRI